MRSQQAVRKRARARTAKPGVASPMTPWRGGSLPFAQFRQIIGNPLKHCLSNLATTDPRCCGDLPNTSLDALGALRREHSLFSHCGSQIRAKFSCGHRQASCRARGIRPSLALILHKFSSSCWSRQPHDSRTGSASSPAPEGSTRSSPSLSPFGRLQAGRSSSRAIPTRSGSFRPKLLSCLQHVRVDGVGRPPRPAPSLRSVAQDHRLSRSAAAFGMLHSQLLSSAATMAASGAGGCYPCPSASIPSIGANR